MSMNIASDAIDLKLNGVMGFNGKVKNGYQISNCEKYQVFPMGSMLVVQNRTSGQVAFCAGHSNDLCCIAWSQSNRYLCTGQIQQQGVKIKTIVDDSTRSNRVIHNGWKHKLIQHLGKVQGVDFSYEDEFLASIGGRDDNALVIWDVKTGIALCGSPAGQNTVLALKWLNNRSDRLVTCGHFHVRVWQIDAHGPKMHAMDSKTGNLRRIFQCLTITPDDIYAYIGTKTGDVCRFSIERDDFRSFNDPDSTVPTMQATSSQLFTKGVRTVKCFENKKTGGINCCVGAGDGTIAFVNSSLTVVRNHILTLEGGVTSIHLVKDKNIIVAGTETSNRYQIDFLSQYNTQQIVLTDTCHYGPIKDIIFPKKCSELFVTSSKNDIRIWNINKRREVLRIQIPNITCNCLDITERGTTIVTGWNDGKIRGFYPESGKIKFTITNAHSQSVSALAICNRDQTEHTWRLVSGGDDGRLRIWMITPSHERLVESLKEHRGEITCVKLNKDNSQCITSSADGSCIVWDLHRYVRIVAMFEPTVFKAVLYHPDESQYITCGSSHKITYWDAFDGNAIRVIDGSDAELSALDIEEDGVVFVAGGEDKIIRAWHYDDGIAGAIGHGHSGTVNALKISPDRKKIVSVGSEGGILIWDMPSVHQIEDIVEGRTKAKSKSQENSELQVDSNTSLPVAE